MKKIILTALLSVVVMPPHAIANSSSSGKIKVTGQILVPFSIATSTAKPALVVNTNKSTKTPLVTESTASSTFCTDNKLGCDVVEVKGKANSFYSISFAGAADTRATCIDDLGENSWSFVLDSDGKSTHICKNNMDQQTTIILTYD